MATALAAAPILSTPDDHILEAPPAVETKPIPTSTLSDEELRWTYEIARTAKEIRQGGWNRIALQFPDDMLVDAPRVVQTLGAELAAADGDDDDASRRIHILADTSYSACCVDEIAAEHADSDVVVHYGRTCLSPTSRLPVIHVYTSRRLDRGAVVAAFEAEFADRDARVVVMADLTYQDHVDGIVDDLRAAGYANVVGTAVERNPAALIPNRRIGGGAETADDEEEEEEKEEEDEEEKKKIKSRRFCCYSLFHISDPPTALLLALQTRFASLHVLSTADSSTPAIDHDPTARAAGLLRRRFARVLSLAAAGVVGILVNTLSVSNYLASIDVLRDKISRAGKKSYTVVVGKLNPAKLANFAEMEGWVVVGCWESGLVEDDAGYWRPVITPFEMEVALTSEEERTWGGEWWAGTEKLTREPDADADADADADSRPPRDNGDEEGAGGVRGQESLPPQFDLRTGRLVSHSRPMHLRAADANEEEDGAAVATRVVAGELVSVNGVASPGAEYLRSKRTWQGLGSDFDHDDASTLMEEGRSGVARGYRVGEDSTRH